MVQINKTDEHATLTRIYEITDAEPIQLRHMTISIRPEKVVVTFGDGEWSRMSISGRNVRKDGSVGKSRHTDDYWHLAELPEWAVPLTKYEED